jgi:hypothetical protein
MIEHAEFHEPLLVLWRDPRRECVDGLTAAQLLSRASQLQGGGQRVSSSAGAYVSRKIESWTMPYVASA